MQGSYQPSAAASTAATTSAAGRRLWGRRLPIKLYDEFTDHESFSPLHILIRKNVELFEATEENLIDQQKQRSRQRGSSSDGNLFLGQVGIRCCHCAGPHLPSNEVGKGSNRNNALFYPVRLSDVFPAALSIANSHWIDHCHLVPTVLRMELMNLRSLSVGNKTKKKAWIDSLVSLGVVEDEEKHGLRFGATQQHDEQSEDNSSDETVSLQSREHKGQDEDENDNV